VVTVSNGWQEPAGCSSRLLKSVGMLRGKKWSTEGVAD
jgi:hypothetical protein